MNRKSPMYLTVVAALLLAAVPWSQAAPPPAAALRGTVDVGRYAYDLSDEIAFTFTLANDGSQDVLVLRWQTPFAGIEADLFLVERDGVPVPYVGKLVKRPAPVAEDYLELRAGDSLSGTFDLSAAYDMSIRGQYTVRYRAELQDVLVADADSRLRPVSAGSAACTVESNAVSLWIEGREPEDPILTLSIQAKGGKKPTPPPDPSGEFINCTNTQQNTLTTAKANATTISGKALSYLDGNKDPDLLYKNWFDYYGTVNNGWSTASSHFSAINDAFLTKPVQFDCSCKQRYYAYVYPSQPYKIYLCSVFWTAPNLGTDSKAGTLVHEMSHFNVTAGTDDYVYGSTGALSLAKTDPGKALNNADNHEYFAENQK